MIEYELSRTIVSVDLGHSNNKITDTRLEFYMCLSEVKNEQLSQ